MSLSPQVYNSSHKHLDQLAHCHIHCFPQSLATKLGFNYVRKTLEWFLVADNRFLFHIEGDGIIAGYCGGFIPKGYGDGSSSGMLQYAFIEAVYGIIKKPWLLFNKEVVVFYPFIFRNIKTKIFGKPKQRSSPHRHEKKNYIKYAGLVVIGVEPIYRGTEVFKQLMFYFEEQVEQRGLYLCNLSVKKDNERAIRGYKKFGWFVAEEHANRFVMQKHL